jgi:hypothetical protein
MVWALWFIAMILIQPDALESLHLCNATPLSWNLNPGLYWCSNLSLDVNCPVTLLLELCTQVSGSRPQSAEICGCEYHLLSVLQAFFTLMLALNLVYTLQTALDWIQVW